MKSDETTLGDLLSLGEAALTALLGAAQDFKNSARGGRDTLVSKLDLVTREEFDAAFAMIQKARIKQENLDQRLKALEKKKSSPLKTKAKKQIRPQK